ncbi:MAG: alanine racemase [Phycisphaerales bacterium]|nr:alanine racemase [Phycisphaerales bacterium]
MSTSRLEIDLSAVEANVAHIRRILAAGAEASGGGRVGLCGVIKQDAYGLGAPRVAKKLAAMGVDLLAVYSLEEARALAEAPIKTPVLVLMPIYGLERNDPLYRLAVGGRLHLVLHSQKQAMELGSLAARIGLQLPVHVQLDTGMTRGGSLPDEATELVKLACQSPRLVLAGVMTHFSNPGGDEVFTREQARLFKGWIEGIKPLLTQARTAGKQPTLVHAANTVAALHATNLHATCVRIGQGLFGYGGEEVDVAAAQGLSPAVRWISRIVHVHEVPAGWPVGYCRTWHARRASRIAVVPVGYANGYPLGLSNRGVVRLTGRPYDHTRTAGPHERIVSHEERTAQGKGSFTPVVGRVSMDQITIDVTDAAPGHAEVGAEVELIGMQRDAPNSLPNLALQAGTIVHEFLCRIAPAPSVERTYVMSGSALVGEPVLKAAISASGASAAAAALGGQAGRAAG